MAERPDDAHPDDAHPAGDAAHGAAPDATRSRSPTSPRERLGPRVRDVRRLRPADLRRADDVHEAAVGHGRRGRSARRDVDVAIVGAPFDDAVSHRPGARFGPARDPRGPVHVGLDPLAPAGRSSRSRSSTVVDAGDANIVPAWIERAHALIYRKVHEVAATGAIPIVLGGDHSITWPSATAVAEVRRPGSIGIVHFDAHADTANDDWGVLARPRHADAAAHRVGRGRAAATSSRSGCAATGRRSTCSSGCRSRACAGTS